MEGRTIRRALWIGCVIAGCHADDLRGGGLAEQQPEGESMDASRNEATPSDAGDDVDGDGDAEVSRLDAAVPDADTGAPGLDAAQLDADTDPLRDAGADGATPVADGATPTADAGPRDAGPRDAGTGDAGADGATPGADAGTHDASTGDAAVGCVVGSVPGPVDVVLALDTSGSMATQACQFTKGSADFEDSLPTNVHVTALYSLTTSSALGPLIPLLCGTSDPMADAALAKDTQRYLHVDTLVDSNDFFQVALTHYDDFKAHLRPGAPTHFVVVTDDNIKGMTAASFKQQMEAKLGHAFTYHALASGNSCGTAPSTEHYALADLTGGQKVVTCEAGFSYGAGFEPVRAAIEASACH
ncbi:MAG: VWA domain-containing protein [Myxococcales bacterium]